MEGGGGGVDRLSGLGLPMLWNILSKFDLPEVIEMKLICPRFRNVIESNAFARYYDRREGETPSWAAVHVFADQNSVCGVVIFVRDLDGREFSFNLEPILSSRFIFPASRITLLCVTGSLLLFRVPLVYGGRELVAINPFSQQINRIQAPVNFSLNRRHHLMLTPDPAHDFEFMIQYGQIDGEIPFICRYNSFENQWGPIINGNGDDDDLPLETDDPRNMVLYQQNMVYYLAFIPGFMQPEFQVNATADLFDIAPLNLHLDQLYYGLSSFVSLHFSRGGTGFAVLLIRQYRRTATTRLYFKNIYLYRLNASGTNVEHVSTFPHQDLPTRTFTCGPVHTLDVTNGIVKFAIPVIVYPHRSYLLFTFNLADGTWSFEIVPVAGAYRLAVPDFTSRLTIRC